MTQTIGLNLTATATVRRMMVNAYQHTVDARKDARGRGDWRAALAFERAARIISESLRKM